MPTLAMQTEPKHNNEVNAPSRPIRALVVDDSPSMLAGLCRFLEAQGRFEVVATASSGPGAVIKAETFRPEVVLMDLELPEFDGLTATRLILQTLPQASIIIVSVHDTEVLRAASRSTGALEFVPKDRISQELLAAVYRAYAVKHGPVAGEKTF